MFIRRVTTPFLLWCALAPAAAAQSSPLPGWPFELGQTSALFSPPTFGDVTGDGRVEVVCVLGKPLAIGLAQEGLYAFRADGGEVRDGDLDPSTHGLLRAFDFSGSHMRGAVTLGELDGMPGLESLFYSGNTLQVIRGNGASLPGWPLQFSTPVDAYASAPIVVADVDQDGFEDVIFTSGYDTALERSMLHVVDRFGAPLPGWPVILPRATFGIRVYNIVVGDFWGDGRLEIVATSTPAVVTAPREIVAFDHRGAQRWSYSFAAHDLVAGDIEDDGRLELVALERPQVVAGRWVTRLLVLRADGLPRAERTFDLGPRIDTQWTETVNGIPNVTVRRESNAWTGAHPYNEHYPDVLFLGDVDGDGSLEAVFSIRYLDMQLYGNETLEVQYPTIHRHFGATYAVDLANLAVLPAFPLRHPYITGSLVGPTDRYLSADRLIDLDGDGRQELVTSEVDFTLLSMSEVTLRFWDALGQERLERTLRATTLSNGLVLEPVFRRASFGDVDQDGRLDFGVNMRRGELHLESLDAPVVPHAPNPHGAWPVYRQNERRTGVLLGR